MTVKELIELLKKQNQDAVVLIETYKHSYDSICSELTDIIPHEPKIGKDTILLS